MVAEIQTQQVANNSCFLDPKVKCAQAQEFDERLSALIIGQENAVRSMGSLYQLFLAGMNQSNKPVGALLFPGADWFRQNTRRRSRSGDSLW